MILTRIKFFAPFLSHVHPLPDVENSPVPVEMLLCENLDALNSVRSPGRHAAHADAARTFMHPYPVLRATKSELAGN